MKATKLSKFATAHRLRDYDGKCENIHGHNYVVEITVEGEVTSANHILVDFGDIKRIFDGWLQDNWDHATIVRADDYTLLAFLKAENMRFFVMNQNSTAEYMAEFLLSFFPSLLEKEDIQNVTVSAIKVWETDTSFAVAERSSK